MATPLPDGFNVEVAKLQLAVFLANNPYSTVTESEPHDPWPFVKKPWGEDSIEIKVPSNNAAFIAAMNEVILPERFAAIWHRDTKEFEVIYTAYPLVGSQKEMVGRKFSFALGNTTVECEFGTASGRLLTIAEQFFTVGMSHTNHRNVGSFKHYVRMQNDPKAKKEPDAIPMCFWIRGLEWDEAKIADVAMHLNFYMTYFDTQSPAIIVLPPKQEPSQEKVRERYLAGYFPKEIRGRELNLNLLHYWSQARISDAQRKFLYSYQIIEYASFYFVEESVKQALRRALDKPNIAEELDNVIIEIMDSVSEKKNWDGTKMQKLLKTVMTDAKLLWREIEKNRDYFSKSHRFDGEFVLPALISSKENEDTFCTNWEGDFSKAMRDIRNALSHGREQSTTGVIAPTSLNQALLRPWAELVMLIAGEVMVYSHASM